MKTTKSRHSLPFLFLATLAVLSACTSPVGPTAGKVTGVASLVVNVQSLEKLSAEGKIQNGIVNPEVLVKLGLVKKATEPIKVLGNGELKAKLDVTAHAFSTSAAQKIETAGGKVQTISSKSKE